MRILVVGAGALGGYFGGRLLEAGANVTFLVRPRRALQLAQSGLQIKSAFGDVTLTAPPCIETGAIASPFDLVMVACKAYDLESAMEAFAPAIGPQTAILPLLNGMRHVHDLGARFGEHHVLGGVCMISTVLDTDGTVRHLNDTHALTFGELEGRHNDRVAQFEAACAAAKFDGRSSLAILQIMWEKWIFIASAAGITCLMRASVGDIVAAGAADLAMSLFEECAAVAAQNGCPVRPAAVDEARAILTRAGSPWSASMYRDIQRGARTEADHVLGNLIQHAVGSPCGQLLRAAYAHVRAYEIGRARREPSDRPPDVHDTPPSPALGAIRTAGPARRRL
jgi:2-dehydropantoate 2-reductase